MVALVLSLAAVGGLVTSVLAYLLAKSRAPGSSLVPRLAAGTTAAAVSSVILIAVDRISGTGANVGLSVLFGVFIGITQAGLLLGIPLRARA